MSELKAIRSGEIYNIIEYEDCYRTDDLYYPKSEADKVIADLEESHKMEVEQLLLTILELKEKLEAPQLVMRLNKPEALYSDLETMGRLSHEKYVVERRELHHKYKRCLAMAKWCRLHDEFTQLESERLGLPQRAIFMEYRRKAMRWNKWHKRWLALAEKFKPNSTAK